MMLSGEDATEADFKRLAPQQRVLHLATHGIERSDSCEARSLGTRGVGGVEPLVRKSSPRHSRPGARVEPAAPREEPESRSPWEGRQVLLALAGANHALEHRTDENEGLLTAEEVTTLDLRGVDWVVLSACHSAAGEAWAREGVLGMQRAFHLAGARTIIASQWSVDDDATQEWMRQLYRARIAGARSAAESMASACRATLKARRKSGRSIHPFYWAAFTSSGE
jgi:CHAT domain-containing protein